MEMFKKLTTVVRGIGGTTAVVLLTGLGVHALTSAPVAAADYNVRLHTNQPASENAYQYVFATKFSELVSEYTDGAVEVTIFPGSQLGRDPAVFQQIQLGAVQMGIFAFPNVVEFYPQFNIFAMPYLFEDFDGAAKALMGPTAKSLYAAFEEATGVKPLGVFNGGFRGITNAVRPINSPSDLAGLKIRVPGSPILIDTLSALDINPVNISAGDLFTALQLGTVDGQESGVSWSFGQGYAEVQKYLTLTEHAVSGTGLFVNASYFEGMPDDVQVGVEKAMLEALDLVNAFSRDLDEATIAKYESAGLEITRLAVDEMRPLMESVWEKYAPEVGGIELIERLVADGETTN